MKTLKVLTLVLLLSLSAGCAIDPYTGEKRMSGKGWGALAGAGIGALAGGLAGGGKWAAIGGASGAALGAGAGHFWDVKNENIRKELERAGIRTRKNAQGQIEFLIPGYNFRTGSAMLNQGYANQLSGLVTVANRHDDYRIAVVGHTDSTGSNRTNQRLSQARADSVVRAMQNLGLKSSVFATGAGEDQPVASNSSAQGRAQNRRVTITFVPIQ